MRDVQADVARWLAAGEPVAIATVVSTWGSAPRPAGSRMAVSQSGRIAGGVSGGCVEADVQRQAHGVLSGEPAAQLHYGVSDDLAWDVRLTCGGEIDVLLEPLTDLHRRLMDRLAADRPVVLMIALDGPLGARRLLEEGEEESAPWLEMDRPARRDGWLIEPFPRAPQLFIIGESHVAVALCGLASMMGFRVSIIEPRAALAAAERFPAAAQVIRQWPDEALGRMRLDGSSYVLVLSHDPKFEDPAITAALAGSPRYLGVIGSRATQRNRVKRLRKAGLSADAIGRIVAPIGLDIGAQTAEETALAILAQMVAAGHGREGGSPNGRSEAAAATAHA